MHLIIHSRIHRYIHASFVNKVIYALHLICFELYTYFYAAQTASGEVFGETIECIVELVSQPSDREPDTIRALLPILLPLQPLLTQALQVRLHIHMHVYEWIICFDKK